MEQRYTFILRIWQHTPTMANLTATDLAVLDAAIHDTAAHEPELGELRGTLQAFDSAQVQHFSSLRDLHALLHAILSASSPPSDDHSAPSGSAAATG